ncbi:MAG: peptidase M42 [Planctomycetota bacterium]|nr:peptidase M42 [Planctomycetota bacterium]MEE2883267.1 peptidase M42 [Planctomycetota bacterium]
MSKKQHPWHKSMPDPQFERMQRILSAPSPVGLEAAMTEGVLAPMLEEFIPEGWSLHRFRGNAGLVVDTMPDAPEGTLTVMAIGHADKIRMQVRSIGDDGKIWINSDSFLPTTLIGHEVTLFSEDPENPGQFRSISGGTVEALGAIHFAEPPLREGTKGIKSTQLYLELQLSGEDRKKQVENLGIRSGDPLLLDRPIRRGFGPDSFVGAYLDNGLGCFVVEEAARIIAAGDPLKKVRYLGAFAAYEEIGRFGSRVMAGVMKPDVIIGVDVNHDYEAAPGIGDRRYTPLRMGEGMTIAVGAVATTSLNAIIQAACKAQDIPYQVDVSGRDTGTDAMAGVLAGVDSAAASIGFPIRNMHTISESAHTGDVIAAIHALVATLRQMDAKGTSSEDLCGAHPRLDEVDSLAHDQ